MEDRMNPPFAVRAAQVSFTYPEGTNALQEVDFGAEPGNFVALLASNGSGKTTLLKILVGLLKAQQGRVWIQDRDIGDFPPEELYQRVGMVFQNPEDQLFGATVEEDVAFGVRNLGLSEPAVRERVAASLESVAALELRERAIHHLSFGEKKRVAVAGVLAMRPETIILDEPTAGLDPAGESLMLDLLQRLNREQKITVILATHSVDLLPLFADQIYILNRGRMLCRGPAEEVFRDHELTSRAGLRLPSISSLLLQMKRYDGVPIPGLPLTIGKARQRLLDLIPEDLLVNPFKGGNL
jgi:cobalt/nickel transport system ATP-binding protein